LQSISRKETQKKKKKKILSFFKFILISGIFAAILVCVGLSPLFSVNRIEVYAISIIIAMK